MSSRGRQTFQFSLTEFVLFTSFCFLLVTVISIQELESVRDKAESSAKAYGDFLEINDEIGKLSKVLIINDFSDNLGYIKKLNKNFNKEIDVEENWQTISVMSDVVEANGWSIDDLSRLSELERSVKRLRRKLLDGSDTGGTVSDLIAYIDNIEQSIDERLNLKGLSESLDRAKEVDKFKRELDRLATKYGRDRQNCIEPHAKTTRYLARVTLSPDTIYVEPIDKSFPDSYRREGQVWNYQKFEEFSERMILYGDRQTIPCRFFLRVSMDVTDVEIYRSRLYLLEHYFYKYLEQ